MLEELKDEKEEQLEKNLQQDKNPRYEKKLYISFSKIATYLACGQKFYYRYEKGIIPPLSVSLFAGQCLHRTVEKILKEQKAGKLLTFNEIQDLYFEIANNLLKTRKVIAISYKEKKEGLSTLIRHHLKSGLQALQVFNKTRIAKISPENIIDIEHPINFDALETCYAFFDDDEIQEKSLEDNLKNVIVIGYIDYLCHNQLCEIKTTSRIPGKSFEKYLEQVSLYAVGYLKEFGFYPEKIRLDILVMPDNPNEKIQYLPGLARIQEEKIEKYFRRLNIAVHGIKKGVFLVPSSNYLCNFCAYKELKICKYFV